MRKIDDTASGNLRQLQIGLRPEFWVTYMTAWTVSLVAMFVRSQYQQQDAWSNMVSFFSNEPPGNVTPECLPSPVGVHYFGDLVSWGCASLLKNPYRDSWGSAYFPMAYWVGKPFGWLLDHGLITALYLFWAVFAAIIAMVWKISRRINSENLDLLTVWVIFSIVLSAPGIGVLDRGNAQVTVFLALLMWMSHEYKAEHQFGAIWLGVAIAIKGYPIIFAVNYIRERRWRSLATVLLTASLGFVVPIVSFEGSLTLTVSSFLNQLTTHVQSDGVVRYNSSLLGLFRVIEESTDSGSYLLEPLNKLVAVTIREYAILSLALAVVLIVFAMSRSIGFFEFLVLGSVFCCLLIEVVGSYVLGFFWLPLLVACGQEEMNSRRRVTLFGIALILVPKGLTLGSDSGVIFSLTTVLNPILMIVISLVCCAPLGKRLSFAGLNPQSR